jgi:hypothetical protein
LQGTAEGGRRVVAARQGVAASDDLAIRVPRGAVGEAAGVLDGTVVKQDHRHVEGGQRVGGEEACLRVEPANVAAQERAVGAADKSHSRAVHGAQLAVFKEPEGGVSRDTRLVDDSVFWEPVGTRDALECSPASLHEEPTAQEIGLLIAADMNRGAVHEKHVGRLMHTGSSKDLIPMVSMLNCALYRRVGIWYDQISGVNCF